MKNHDAIQYRRVSPDDKELIQSLSEHYSLAWEETYKSRLSSKEFKLLLEDASESSIANWLMGDGVRSCRIAMKYGEIIGAVASKCLHDTAYVWGMYIRQTFQKKGIGQQLLQQCIAEVRSKDVRQIELFPLESSKAAIAFYENNGFVKVESIQVELVDGLFLPAWKMSQNFRGQV